MISALKGRGTGDLLDLVVERFPASPEQPTEKAQAIRVAILGRPNVGKSSLINAIVGEEKVIVTDMPGTTRDSIDTHVERDGVRFILIDTAGLRRQSRVQDDIEFYSVTRTIRSLERCDVAVVLMDAVDGVSAQDMRIVARVEAAGKGLILVLNKWDLVDTVRTPAEQYTDAVRTMMRFADFAPLIFVSAHTRRGVAQLLKQVVRVDEERMRRVSTGELNKAVERMVAYSPPPSTPSGKFVKIFYCTQASVAPPTFVFFTNHPEALDETYKRFLTNQLRERFGFTGTTIRVLVRGRPDREARVGAGRRSDRRTG